MAFAISINTKNKKNKNNKNKRKKEKDARKANVGALRARVANHLRINASLSEKMTMARNVEGAHMLPLW
jgi:hypothetical protein